MVRRGGLGLCFLLLAGCANFPSNITPGMDREQVVSRFGTPSVEVRAEDHSVLIYSTAPMGEVAYAAILDGSGQVERVVQVLTLENFGRIEPQVWTKQTVLNNFGVPADRRQIRGNEAWDYRYRENNVYYSLFTVTFAQDGLVLKGENGPDLLFDGGGERGHH